MIIDELKEVNADIAMMEELSLPVSAQKIQERESLESKYWPVKVLCELMTQREYFANQHK